MDSDTCRRRRVQMSLTLIRDEKMKKKKTEYGCGTQTHGIHSFTMRFYLFLIFASRRHHYFVILNNMKNHSRWQSEKYNIFKQAICKCKIKV